MRSCVFIRFALRGVVFTSALAVGVVSPQLAGAQGGAGQPPARPTAGAAATSPKRVSISKAVFGDAGVIVNARDDGYIEIAG